MSDTYETVETAETAETTAPVQDPVVKKKREGKKMSEKQKTDLTKHMEKQKKAGMTASEMKSHRMKMMSRMRQDPKITVTKAHKMLQ
mgnify:CR=1 FL=1